MKRWIGRLIFLGILVGLGYLGLRWYRNRNAVVEHSYRTSTVDRGDIISTIAATGTLEPTEVVDVGAQVAAKITKFGVDVDGKTVDYGSHVRKGDLLAQLDSTQYDADLKSAQAQIDSAKAGVQVAQANVDQAKAKLVQAQNDWDRAQKLGSNEALAASSYDNYKATFDVAKATVSVDEAALVQSKTQVEQAEAAAVRAKQNVDYCVIDCPDNGVIIDRRVNVGQTVVASLNAPSLFLIAKDLSHMEVWVSVNEADIGKIFTGQSVTFQTDAFAGQTFYGKVEKVRLNAQMTSNVVTYTVEVATDNQSGRLLPYMTANANFEVDRRTNVLDVPNSALRYDPSDDQKVPEARTVAASVDMSAGPASEPSGEHHGGGWGGSHRGPGATSAPSSRPAVVVGDGTLWTQEGKLLKPIHVKTGLTDGINTEVWGDGVSEDLVIVTGENYIDPNAAAASGGSSPFMPQMRRGGGRR